MVAAIRESIAPQKSDGLLGRSAPPRLPTPDGDAGMCAAKAERGGEFFGRETQELAENADFKLGHDEAVVCVVIDLSLLVEPSYHA